MGTRFVVKSFFDLIEVSDLLLFGMAVICFVLFFIVLIIGCRAELRGMGKINKCLDFYNHIMPDTKFKPSYVWFFYLT